MKTDQLILGEYQNNCYILRSSQQARDCVIIDTGLECSGLLDFLQKHQLTPVSLILTHGHADHIAGIPVLKDKFPSMKVQIHELDSQMLTKATSNLSPLAGRFFKTEPADILLGDGNFIELAGIKLQVLHTPGHTPGGICLYNPDDAVLFSGDTLFAESVGRTDFPGGSMTQLIKSIKEKLLTLPDETKVYPGHGPTSTIRAEKSYNPYLQKE